MQSVGSQSSDLGLCSMPWCCHLKEALGIPAGCPRVLWHFAPQGCAICGTMEGPKPEFSMPTMVLRVKVVAQQQQYLVPCSPLCCPPHLHGGLLMDLQPRRGANPFSCPSHDHAGAVLCLCARLTGQEGCAHSHLQLPPELLPTFI